MIALLLQILPYAFVIVISLLFSLLLTPFVREFNRSLGMVDKPDPRRINKVPIPRGGGIAIVLAVFATIGLFKLVFPDMLFVSERLLTLILLTAAMALLGWIDDKFSLPPKVKLLGQVAVAFLTWLLIPNIGFLQLWPELPQWLDAMITVFWIVGAVNAFNLIDGLDGLASGLALIATLAMSISLIIIGRSSMTYVHFALIGALLGFLRYNFNPASVFLGDCGSMFLGYMIATMALVTHTSNSLMVSVGVPLLAMGVPIFDTALAIFRRSLRRIINKRIPSIDNDRVMTADIDHLHHRLLRESGFNQRRVALVLYGCALVMVTFGLVGMMLKSHAGGIWLIALSLAVYVIVVDMKRVELFDLGRLAGDIAHSNYTTRMRLAKLSVPILVVCDLGSIVLAFLVARLCAQLPMDFGSFKLELCVSAVLFLIMLVIFRAYRTVWARARFSNFLRLVTATFFGEMFSLSAIYYLSSIKPSTLVMVAVIHGLLLMSLFVFFRLVRQIVRDLFYNFDCSRMKFRKDVSRVLVYGAGGHYLAFRRQLVTSTSKNQRMVVALLDDDPTLKGHFIGGNKVFGGLDCAQSAINACNVDAVVIACEPNAEKLAELKQLFSGLGVKLTHFHFDEQSL